VGIPEADLNELAAAKRLLEDPSLAVKVSNLLGTPIEQGFALLPARWSESVHTAAHSALTRAMEMAVRSLEGHESSPYSDLAHTLVVAANGAAAGAFGLPALLLELPFSTTVMLRSIADIARSKGEDLAALETRLSCLEVFALGGNPKTDDQARAGYFAIRTALARAVAEAARHIAERGIVEEGSPALVRLIASIAGRFTVTVSEKAAAQAVPLIGAAGGAVINTIFIGHFQDMARGHFTVRRLERKFGAPEVRRLYDGL
jgi:hypothetical protein